MDDKVYKPIEIEDAPLPGQEVEVYQGSSQAGGNEVYSPKTVKDTPMPTRIIAHETIGSALNTKSRKILGVFEFIKQGAIQIGEFLLGVSGDIRITPNGITARNAQGDTTFALDGDTGDATFAGTVQTGAIVSGIMAVGNNRIVIDGESRRMVFYDDNGVPQIVIGEA